MTSSVQTTVQVFAARHDDQPQVLPFLNGSVAVFSRRSPEKETVNQDAIALVECDDQRGVIILADGCGGMPRGEEASRIAVESLAAAIAAEGSAHASLRGCILDGIEKAHAEIRGLGLGSGTTVAVAEFNQGAIRCYHAGDSLVLHVGGRGKIKTHTRAHSPTGYAVESGLLSEDDAISHEERYLVSNFLGADDYHIEVGRSKQVAARDTVLVSSDGLFDNLYVDDIIDTIRKGPLAAVARELQQPRPPRGWSPTIRRPPPNRMTSPLSSADSSQRRPGQFGKRTRCGH